MQTRSAARGRPSQGRHPGARAEDRAAELGTAGECASPSCPAWPPGTGGPDDSCESTSVTRFGDCPAAQYPRSRDHLPARGRSTGEGAGNRRGGGQPGSGRANGIDRACRGRGWGAMPSTEGEQMTQQADGSGPGSSDGRRAELIEAAQARWVAALTDLGGRNTLLYYKDRRGGTLALCLPRPAAPAPVP